MPSRDLSELTPVLRQKAIALVKECGIQMKGYEVKPIQTSRSLLEQTAYWARGRQPVAVVNEAYKTAGLPPITEKENYIITHTMNSMHLRQADGFAHAFDIGIFKGGKYLTDPELYREVAMIGKELGLECGYFWKGKKCDPPHYQLKRS